jgi:C-terminal processing protease CtpA/Prc
MKRNKSFIISILLASLILVFTGCRKDDESIDEINKFIWTGLHDYYLWTENVPNLSDSKYPNEGALKSFVNKYTDHEELFYDLLYQYEVIDKWSWIVDDYNELENQLQGISKTMGFDFRLVRISESSNNIFGYVRYVFKNSPAYYAGMKRGQIFIKVNDQQLTVGNYQSLLFSSDSYKLSFADINGNNIVPNGKSVNLTAVEMQENPILLDTIYNINSSKIGYLVYNGFLPDFDIELNNVFKDFKTNGINKLILDFRYNGGGSIQSAINLASMIYGSYTNKIFCKTKYNKYLQPYLLEEYGADFFNNYFEDTIKIYDENDNITAKDRITSLNLTEIYIITTDNTASASELVINGLKSYISVYTIGTNTHGKYVGSITLKDYINNKGDVNPHHKWAMQPIVLKISSSTDVSDYVNGFTPNVSSEEDFTNLIPLGDLNEPMLDAAINYITGSGVMQPQVAKSKLKNNEVVFDSKLLVPYKTDMYLNLKIY